MLLESEVRTIEKQFGKQVVINPEAQPVPNKSFTRVLMRGDEDVKVRITEHDDYVEIFHVSRSTKTKNLWVL